MKTNNITFNGINISNADILGYKMKIYKLTHNDAPFIEKLGQNINLKKLNPQITQEEFDIYNSIFHRSLDNALHNKNTSLLLSCGDKPCGIIVNIPQMHTHFIDYVCTWPLEPNKKAPFGAQTLFVQIFKNFLETNAKSIELYAIRFGGAISKYIRIGFKSMGGDNYTELMKISREKVAEYYKKLNEHINLEPTNNHEDIDLLKELKY